MRIAYEALAWGRHVSTWDRSVARRPARRLTRRSGCAWTASTCCPAAAIRPAFADVPAEKLFFLQLADAPQLRMDVLQWSRHHRLFPGQGAFDLARLPAAASSTRATPGRCRWRCSTTSSGRPTRPGRRSTRMRSLLWLEEQLAAPDRRPATRPGHRRLRSSLGWSFVELAVDGVSGPRVAARRCAALGFAHTGQHRSKPVQLWEQGAARVLLNDAVVRARVRRDRRGRRPRAGERRPGPLRRAAPRRCCAPVLPRDPRARAEADLSAVAAPDGTQVFFTRTGPDGWPADFLATGDGRGRGAGLTGVDHVGLTQPFDSFDEAALFYRAVLGLEPQTTTEVAAPFGLVRTRAVTDPGRAVRLALSVAALRRGGWAPAVPGPAVRRLRHRRHRRHRRGAAGGRRAAAARAGQLRRRPRRPARPGRRSCWPRSASTACCTTRTSAAATCTWPPRCSATGSSSRSCSGWAATTATAPPTPRCGWPRTAVPAPRPRHPAPSAECLAVSGGDGGAAGVEVGQRLAQLHPPPVDPAAHRAQLDPQRRRDLLVRQPLDVAQHHRHPELRRQRIQRRLHLRIQMRVGVHLPGLGEEPVSRSVSSGSASNRIRARRRTMSRNRFVVIRCNHPSNVPGVYCASDRNTRTNVSCVRSSASCALPDNR